MSGIRFDVPADVVFDYFADPVNRPAWQSSLRRVENLNGPVGVGQTWTDVTKPGLRPAMRTTVYERPTRWAESGTWRFVRADLDLEVRPEGTGCAVEVTFRITGPGPVALLGRLAGPFSRPAVLADVRRAKKLLETTRS